MKFKKLPSLIKDKETRITVIHSFTVYDNWQVATLNVAKKK